jgi:hypothetical protein
VEKIISIIVTLIPAYINYTIHVHTLKYKREQKINILRANNRCNNCTHANHMSMALCNCESLLTVVYFHDNKWRNSTADIAAVTNAI